MNKYIIFMTELQTNLVLNNMFRYVCKIWVGCMNTKTQGCYSNILKNECNAIYVLTLTLPVQKQIYTVLLVSGYLNITI